MRVITNTVNPKTYKYIRVIVILYYNPTHRQMNEHKIMGDETCGQTRQGMSVAHYSKDMDKDTDF